jgi:hypothetical protein
VWRNGCIHCPLTEFCLLGSYSNCIISRLYPRVRRLMSMHTKYIYYRFSVFSSHSEALARLFRQFRDFITLKTHIIGNDRCSRWASRFSCLCQFVSQSDSCGRPVQRQQSTASMSDLFSFDSTDLLDVGTGSGLLWSPEGKLQPKQSIEPVLSLQVSPPNSKEAFQKLRTKYQSALSTLNGNVQNKSTKHRRRQSFAISQMLQSVTTIASTPLKMSTADTERLVESMRKSTVKRKSMVPRSNRKTRALALRRVSRSIDDIFDSHFADTAHLGSLTAPTPHHNKDVKLKSSKEILLVDRFEDDPVMHVLGGECFQDNGHNVPQAAASPVIRRTPSTTPRSLQKPGSARSTPHVVGGGSHRKSTASSTAANISAPGTPKASTPRTHVQSARRVPVSQPQTPASPKISTPTRATPTGHTPYYTALGSMRPAMHSARTPHAIPLSASKRLSSVAATASMAARGALGGYSSHKLPSTPQSSRGSKTTADTSVHLSAEKMGAFLQSMQRNDALHRNRHAALTVSKDRACTPSTSCRTGHSSAVKRHVAVGSVNSVAKALPFTDCDVEPSTQHCSGDYECDLAYDGSCDDSRIMDAVLGLDLDMAAFADAEDGDEEDSMDVVDVEVSQVLSECATEADGENFVGLQATAIINNTEAEVVEDENSASNVCEEGDADTVTVIPEEHVTVLTIHVDDGATDGPVDSAEVAVQDQDPALSGYGTDSSTSPQIVRVRYSVGSTARRSLSNTRGRISLGALEGVGLAGDRADTSPVVFHAPVSKPGSRRPSLGGYVGNSFVNNAREEAFTAAVNAEASCSVRCVSPQSATLPAMQSTTAARATPRSMSKGALRVRSAAKSAPTSSSAPTDSDTEGSPAAHLAIGSAVVRAAAQGSRRKSLGNVSVSNLIRRFQGQQSSALPAQQLLAATTDGDAVTSAPTVATSDSSVTTALSPRSPRSQPVVPSTVLEEGAITAAGEVLASPAAEPRRTTRSASKTKSAQKKTTTPAAAGNEGDVDVCSSLRKAALEILNTLGAETPVTPLATQNSAKSTGKKGRASTTKTSRSAAKSVAADIVADEGPVFNGSDTENAPASVVNTIVPLASALKTTSKRRASVACGVTLAVPTADDSETPRPYALRSSRKSMVTLPATPSITVSAAPGPEDAAADPARELFGTLPNSSIKSGAVRTPRTKAANHRATLGASKTPAGTYTALKVKRVERNRKLDELCGTCDELLSMIDATIQT